MVGREGLLGSEVAAVLRDQDETRIGSVIQTLRPGVTNSKANVVSDPLVEVNQQPVELGVPARVGLEKVE